LTGDNQTSDILAAICRREYGTLYDVCSYASET
jgi:hypothetical protein